MRFLAFYSLTIPLLLCYSCQSGSPESNQKDDSSTQIQQRASEAVSDHHNSKISLDWDGVYAGILPCVDCEGIKTTVRLKKNQTYTGSSVYLGKNPTPLPFNGTFSWTPNGGAVILKGDAGGQREFKVVEGGLILTKTNGEAVKDENGQKYILAKANPQSEIENKHWSLTKLNGKKIDGDSQKKPPYFFLNSFEKRANGSLGCNRFFAEYTITTGDSLSFSKVGTTMMACADMSIEDQLGKILDAVSHYTLKDSVTMSVDTGSVEDVAVFKWRE